MDSLDLFLLHYFKLKVYGNSHKLIYRIPPEVENIALGILHNIRSEFINRIRSLSTAPLRTNGNCIPVFMFELM